MHAGGGDAPDQNSESLMLPLLHYCMGREMQGEICWQGKHRSTMKAAD